MPYARTFGALAALAGVAWTTAITLLVLSVGHKTPMPVFNFMTAVAVAITIVAAQVWVCAFAARGRAQLVENTRGALMAEARTIAAEAVAQVLRELAARGLAPRGTDGAQVDTESHSFRLRIAPMPPATTSALAEALPGLEVSDRDAKIYELGRKAGKLEKNP